MILAKSPQGRPDLPPRRKPAFFNFAGPFDDEGHTVSSLVDIALDATILARAPLFEFRQSFESVGLGSIVGGEDDQGVVRQSRVFQGVQHLAHHGVGLDDEVPVVTGFRFSVIRLVRDYRIVRRIEGEVSEEGLHPFSASKSTRRSFG